MIFISTDILNPYKREIVSQDSYKTLIDFLQDKYPNGFKRPTDVSINGIEIAIDDYDTKLNEIDVIVLLDRAALPVGLIGGWFITALANLAISVTLSYIANKLFAPDSPEEQAQPSSVYNLNSAQNVARYGSPIPIIYGKVRMFPAMIVQPYYKFENDIEYLYHILCIGQGTNTTDDVLISDDKITSTEDLQWKLLYQSDFYNIPLNAYGMHITKTLSNPSNMEIEVGDGESEKYTIGADAQYVEFDYMYPNGLIYYESDGGTTAIKTSFEYTLYTYNGSTYTQVKTESFYMNVSNVNPIQITKRVDVSAYNEEVFISFEKTLNAASSFYVTNTYIKRVKAIYPNEDFTQLYGDITLLAVKIKATNAVSSIGQVKVNGYFERTDVGNTMAEVLTDLYTNTSYGGGLSVDDLSFPSTTTTVNCAYDSSMTIFDAMRKPALAQGYSLYLAGMDVILKKDGVNTTTSGMYNEMNILRNSLKVQYLFKEEFPSYDGFECTYIDTNWLPQTEIYPATSIRPQRVDLFGVAGTIIDLSDCGDSDPLGDGSCLVVWTFNGDFEACFGGFSAAHSGTMYWEDSPMQQAIVFDRTGHANSDFPIPVSSALTIAVELQSVYITSPANTSFILDSNEGYDGFLSVRRYNNDILYTIQTTGGTVFLDSNAPLINGVWNTHFFILNGTSFEHWIENTLFFSATLPNPYAGGTLGETLNMGGRTSAEWAGKFDHLMVFNKAISSTERQDLVAYFDTLVN